MVSVIDSGGGQVVGLPVPTAWRSGHGGRNVSPSEVRWEPLLERFATMPRQLLDNPLREGTSLWRQQHDGGIDL